MTNFDGPDQDGTYPSRALPTEWIGGSDLDRFEAKPITPWERRKYKEIAPNLHVLSQRHRDAYHALSEADFIREVMRGPHRGLLKEMMRQSILKHKAVYEELGHS